VRVSLIWAMTRDRVIGRDNTLPWRLPDEMRHFVRTTRGKPVIMGRRQFESMPRALPGRANIVLSRKRGYRAEGAQVVADLDAAIALAEQAAAEKGKDEIMVIGGGEIYALALPRADRLYMTLIDADIEGDTLFPPFDENAWLEISRHDYPADDRHPFAYSIRVLDRAK